MNVMARLVDTTVDCTNRQHAWRHSRQDTPRRYKKKQPLRLHIESLGISSNSPTCSSKSSSSSLPPAPFNPKPSTPQIDALPRTASDKSTTVARSL